MSHFIPRFIFMILVLMAWPTQAKAQPDLLIKFGSYCCGPDIETEEKIMEYLRFSQDIRSWKVVETGFKEGEHSLEINLIGGADREQIYEDIKGMIPRYSDTAPTSIEGSGFPKYETGMTPEHNK